MHKRKLFVLAIAASISVAANLSAAENGRINERPIMEPRTKGVPQFGTSHTTTRTGAKPIRTPVFHDRRNHTEIRRDPHIVVFHHEGWHPRGHWEHWHRDWGSYWRVRDWAELQTVTCEAVDTQGEMLFPVTETRSATWFWTDALVDNVAARALDDCAAETGHPDSCVLVERECWNSIY